MTTKGSKRFLWVFLSVWAVLVIVFSFQDLNVSKTVYNEYDSQFGHFFEVYGEHPAILILFVAGSVLFRTAGQERKGKRIVLRIFSCFISLLGGFGGAVLIAFRQFERTDGLAMLICLIAAFVAFACAQMLLRRLPAETLKWYTRAAWAAIAIVIAEMLIINVLKVFWGRIRFRNMNGNYELFTPWFAPQGIQADGLVSEAYKSFPSGHSANGWAMMVWMLFMPFKRMCRSWMLGIAVLWGACTSMSRVIMGDHFGTDVLFGAFITIGSMFLLCKAFGVELFPDKQAPNANG